jgi:transcriptional antiterminator NusG
MGLAKADVNKSLQEGDKVKIIDGPFVGMNGTVESIDKENQNANVIIDLFGQETSVEVELGQIDKE